MSTATAYSAIATFLTANWVATPIVYENTDYAIPDTPEAFVIAEISGTSYSESSIGSGNRNLNMWRERGLLWLHIMIPSGIGSLSARQHAETLIGLLRASELVSGALVFGEASVGLGERSTEDGNYWRLSVSIEWQLDT